MATSQEKVEVVFSVRDVASGVLKGIRGSFTELNSIVSLASRGWAQVSQSLGATIKASSEAEKSLRQLEAAAKRHGITSRVTMGVMHEFAGTLQQTLGASDELVNQGFIRMINSGMDVSLAMRTIKASFDLASESSISVETAFDLLAKANLGATQTLSRYGIVVDESIPKAERFAAALKQIEERWTGGALSAADTYTGAVAKLNQQYEELLEKLGSLITGSEVFKAGISAETQRILELNKSIEDGTILFKAYNAVTFGMFSAQIDDVIKKLREEKEVSDKIAATMQADADAVRAYWANKSKLNDLTSVLVPKLEAEAKALGNIRTNMFGGAAAANDIFMKDAGLTTGTVKESKVGQFGTAAALEAEGFESDAMKMQELWKSTTESMKAATASFVANVADGFAEMVMGGKVDFAQMAKDFIKMFISAAMQSLLKFVALAVFNLKLFDKVENDMAIYKSGQDYAKFLTMGISDGLRGYRQMYAPHPYMVAGMGAMSGGGSQTVNINLNVSGSSTFGIERQVIPAIQKAALLGRSRLSMTSGMQLGKLASEVA